MPLSACFLCDADLKTPGARAPASTACVSFMPLPRVCQSVKNGPAGHVGRVRVGAGHPQIHTGIQAK